MKPTRYTVDLDPVFDNTLSILASQKDTTKAEIIKRALATYSTLSTYLPLNSKNKVAIMDQQDRVLQYIIVP